MYDRLEYLGSAYFHQDFDLEHGTPDAVVIDFAEEETRPIVDELASDLDRVLASSLSDAELRELWIKQIHASYDPHRDGMTYREWFAHVRELLTEHT